MAGRRTIGAAGAMALVLAAVASPVAASGPLTLDDAKVFRPRPMEPVDGREPNGRFWNEDWVRRRLGDDGPRLVFEHRLIEAETGRIGVSVVSLPGPSPRPLIIHCGGTSKNRWKDGGGYAERAVPFGDVFFFDYPGYGESDGAATSADLRRAMPTVLAEAHRVAGDRPIVFWGHSLGGFVCSEMIEDDGDAAGLVLEATANDFTDVAQETTPALLRPFLTVRLSEGIAAFDNADGLEGRELPILVLGAGKDTVLPVTLSRMMADELRADGHRVTYLEFPDESHSDIDHAPDFDAKAGAWFEGLDPK